MADKTWPPLQSDPNVVKAVEAAIDDIPFCKNPFDKQPVKSATVEEINRFQDRVSAAFLALSRCLHPGRVARAAALALPPAGSGKDGEPGKDGDPGQQGEQGN